MKVACPSCSTNLNIDDKKIPAGGARIKCPTCQQIFPVKPGGQASAAGAVPLPGGSSGASGDAVPLPGGGAEASFGNAVPLPGGNPVYQEPSLSMPDSVPTPNWDDEETRVRPASAPLPDWDQEDPTRVAPAISAPPPMIPRASGAVPLPGLTAAKPQSIPRAQQETRVGAAPHAPVDLTFDSDAVPLPGNPFGGGGAVPLPGMSAGEEAPQFADENDIAFDDVPTRAYPSAPGVPLPGGVSAGAVPLPGGNAGGFGGAVPLPGSAGARPAGGAVPLPGARAAASAFGASASVGEPLGGAVPLPGGYEMDPNGFSAGEAVPLPGEYHGSAELGAEGPTMIDDPALHQMPQSQPGGFDFSDLPSPKGAAPEPDYSDLPSPKSTSTAEAFDFANLAPPTAPAAADAFDFSDLPSPKGEPLGGPDYSDLPSPRAAPPGLALGADPFESPDFSQDLPVPAGSDLPSPADEFSFDAPAPPPPMRAVPPPAAAPGGSNPAFGEVDFGASEPLEFDPTSAPKPMGDDLEADLSSPPPSSRPAGSTDGLEMLSFIDTTAKEAGVADGPSKTRRFHIRRRSGKVFGPFEDAVIVKMLEDGQLLGNEEVSLDAEAWSPIGGEPTFEAAINQLMESPSSTAPAPVVAGERPPQQQASMDRLKNLYEGRMAAVAVVQGKEAVPLKKRLPLLLAGAAVVLVLAGGAFLGTTPYGYFGLKVLFPAKVKAGSREFAELQAAKKDLQQDTYKAYQMARDAAAGTLKVKEYPEARALWCQAIFYLQRKYAAATPPDLNLAVSQLPNIELLGAKHPEVVKARAGFELASKRPDGALALLSEALARSENADDVELSFLRAEAFVQKNQWPQAKSELEAILKKRPGSARAFHALGNLYQLQKDADHAAGRYAEALKADPEHASSAVELAAIELLIRKNLEKGVETIDQALSPKSKEKLGPAELGKALALKAESLAMRHQPAEAVTLFEEALKADPTNAFTKARLAAAYSSKLDFAKALPLFKEAAEAAPESLDYVEAYLTCLIQLGKLEEALKVVKVASTRFAGNAYLQYLTARIFDGLDRTKEAQDAYLRAASADPQLVEARLYLARLHVRFRRFGDAKPQLEEALKTAPDNADVRVAAGELALAQNELERAATELNKAIELKPDLPEAHVGMSKLNLLRGRAEQSLEEIDKALALNPKVAGGRVQRGSALWKLGRLDEAVKEMELAKKEEPHNTQIIVALGAVQLEKNDLNGAGNNLMLALVTEPSNPEANFYLAKVKNLKAEHNGAIENMKKALDAQPKRAEYRFWMGQIFLEAKRAQEAIDSWKATLEVDPNYTEALEALGHVYLDRNDVKNSVEYFQRALTSDPTRTVIQAAIGDAYSQAENWDQAIITYEKAVRADPKLGTVYFKLGQAYGERNKFDEAIINYKKAAVAEPDKPEVWMALGYAYKERKKRLEAANAFEKYLAMRPDANNKNEIQDEIDTLKKER